MVFLPFLASTCEFNNTHRRCNDVRVLAGRKVAVAMEDLFILVFNLPLKQIATELELELVVVGNHIKVTLPQVLGQLVLLDLSQNTRPFLEQLDEIDDRPGEYLEPEHRVLH